MNTTVLDRLEELERIARPLEPDSGTRREMGRAALMHAESLLDWLDSAPAHTPNRGASEELESAPIGRAPIGFSRALDFLTHHVDRSAQTPTAAGFFAYIPVGNLYPAALGEFLAAVSNRYSGSAIGCAAAVHVENQVLRWLGDLMGYPATSAGNLLSGGSMANLSAIVVAREAAGLRARDVERAVIYMTDQTHHCVAKGLRVAGLGECIQHRIPVDARYRMDATQLGRAMAEDAAAGRIPWLVIGNAGTTDTGAVDPLDAIADIAERHRAWFHCDAAYGGPFALCAEGKRILAGIERSDSVVLDPHKGLYVPFGVGAVLVKNEKAMRAAYRFSASYIVRDTQGDAVSPMDLSPELSRPFRALPLWLALQTLGTTPFEAALEEKLLLARYAHERLKSMPGFETGPEPDLSVVIFRAMPHRGDTNDFNLRLVRAILEDGRISVSATMLGEERWIRMAILSPRTHRSTIEFALEVIAATYEKVLASTQ